MICQSDIKSADWFKPAGDRKLWDLCRNVVEQSGTLWKQLFFFFTFVSFIFYTLIPEAACLPKMFACVWVTGQNQTVDLVLTQFWTSVCCAPV